MTDLRLDWCSYAEAKHAVENWHYSRSLPGALIGTIGVRENGRFIGAVLFGRGANRSIGKPFGLDQPNVCELVRVALTVHRSPTSRIVAISTKLISRRYPSLRLVVSYADTEQGHHGGIYQAAGWLYCGTSPERRRIRCNGRLTHRRTLFSRYGVHSLAFLRSEIDPSAEQVFLTPKHKYLFPLDSAMRAQIAPLAKPYPKRVPSHGETSAVQAEEGGSIPTDALHTS